MRATVIHTHFLGRSLSSPPYRETLCEHSFSQQDSPFENRNETGLMAADPQLACADQG